MSNQYLTFDVTKANQIQQLIVGRQGDNALKSVSMLFWDGEKNRPYDLTGKQVYFEALKPDNSHIVDYAGVTITDPKYGLATYAFNEQVFAVQGMMQQAFFKISETNASGKVITDSALEVSINVLSNSVEFGIKSEDYLSEYDRLIADVEKKFDDYANAVSGNIADVSKAHDDIQALMKQISDNNIVTINEFNATTGIAQTALDEERVLTARYNAQEGDLVNRIETKLSQISTAPETFAKLSALQSTYPNGKTGLFVTADNGHKYIWVNGTWTDAGVYQSVGIADGSIDPIKMNTTFVSNNKISKVYNSKSRNTDLYIINDPLMRAGVVNVVGKFTPGDVYLYLLKKISDKFIVVDKFMQTMVDGWQTVYTNFLARGTGDEYIAVLGQVYYSNIGGLGFYNMSLADSSSTEFITSQLVANTDFAIFTTIENTKLANVISETTSDIESQIPINKFKNGKKDFSKYTVGSKNTTYVLNDPLKQGNIMVHFDSYQVQNANIYIVKKSGLNFTVVKKVNADMVVGDNLIDMDYEASGAGDEYIASTGVVYHAYRGGFGFYEISSTSTVNDEGDIFATDDHTDLTTDLGIYPEYKSDLNKEIEQLSSEIEKAYDDIAEITPKLSLTDYTMPKYSEISDPVGFIGRWFDKEVNGISTKTTINQGSEFYFKVKNTTAININFVLNSALETPYFAYSIDGSPMERQLITTSKLPAVTTDEHIVRVVVDGLNEHEDKFNSEKGVSFKDVTVDSGGTVIGVLPKNKKIMFFGDSITEGIRVLSMDANPNGNSATGAYPFITSQNLNAVSYRVGFGASGVTRGGSGNVPPLLQNIDKMTASRDTPYYEPDLVVINIGTNDGASTSANFISGFNGVLNRLSVKYSGTPIFVILPFNGAKRSEITTCVNGRTNIYLVDTKGWNVETTDGVHPNIAGGVTAGKKLSEYIISVLGKEYFIE